jgi:AraC-like DNA-binding protein
MKCTLRILLLSLVVFSCAKPEGRQASEAEWRQWQSYLERAENHPDSTMILADSALIFARSKGMSDTGFYRPWELKAMVDRMAENYNEAKSWLDSVQLHAADADHPSVEARALNGIGLLLLQTPDWKMAEVPFRDALDLAEEANLSGEKPFALYYWGTYLRKNGQPAAALDTLVVAEQLFRAAGNRRFLGHTYQLRGEILQDQNQLKDAEASYRISLDDFASMGDTLYMSRSYRRLAGLLLSTDADSALYYFKASVKADPRHQFIFSYLSGLTQIGQYHLDQGRADYAMPFLDSAVSFSSERKNPRGLWNAWLLKGVAYLQKNDTTLSDSAFRSALTISLDNGQFEEYTNVLAGWQSKFNKQEKTRSAGRLGMWSDPKKLYARKDFQAVQPKQVLELPASRKAAIQKRQRIKIAIGAGSFLLIVLVVWRLNFRRRNNAFTLYRERAAALAAARSYRRDAIANAESNTAADGTQLVIDRERRVLAMESLFAQEKPHLDPDLSFSAVCERLKEAEPAFRTIVKKMYDVGFEEWLTEYRIEEAILQINAGADLSTIHKSCGFRDSATFRKTFEKVTGLKPGSYLKWPKPPIR